MLSSRTRRAAFGASAMVLLALGGCMGSIGDSLEEGSTPPGEGTGQGNGNGQPGQPGVRATECNLARGFWRLRDDQFAQAVSDLLPGVTASPIATPGRVEGEFVSASDQLPVDERLAAQIDRAAETTAQDVATRVASFVKCSPQQDERSCAGAFIDTLVPRAFRRPLQTGERERLLALYDLGRAEDFAMGIATVVQATLESADFFYRTELGDGTAAGNEIALAPYEQAAALSFFLQNSVPDAELWKSAVDGSLRDAQKLGAQVDRLLATRRAHDNLVKVLGSWLNVERVLSAESTELDAAQRTSMHDDVGRFLTSTLWTGGTVRDLYTSRKAFVDTPMAQFYGVPAPGNTSTAVTLDAKMWSGILTRPGIVAGFASTNRSVFRGKFTRLRILCGNLNPPPATVDIGAFNKSTSGLTEREKVALRAGNASCAGCHAQMDPLGLALEHYDASGRYVTTRDGLPVDASGTLTGTDSDGPFADAIELSDRLGQSATVAACMAGQLYAYATGRTFDEVGICGEPIVAEKAAGLRLDDMMRTIATSQVLRARLVATGGQP